MHNHSRDKTVPTDGPDNDDVIVVGIGASAGGIKALQSFFQAVEPDSGMAYVVILHLSPDYNSKLAEVLQTASTIPVTRVSSNTRVQPDHVYVLSPNQHLVLQEQQIIVSNNIEVEERRAPVDIFFRTLANSMGPAAIGVILSGTGANGSMGMKRIKEMGGAVYVQDPQEAEFDDMPRNSIATNLVDEILPVAQIPKHILAYKKGIRKVIIPVEADKPAEDQQQSLREVFTQLRVRTGHDFSNYKKPTLLRRIERRISVRRLPDLTSYAEHLKEYPDEVHALLKDLLISVTNFFRDKKAFEFIEQNLITKIFASKKTTDHIRIWVAGCATGEEAYSLAMICAEKLMLINDPPKIQIFATDIDEAAIQVAREGLYTINDAADVSPERLRRFFNTEGEFYRVRREIREMILFATHNFLKDPPFSHLDMVSCRNVMIYLNHTAQERVLGTFHFALLPGGYLFLGSAESAEHAADFYTPLNREVHVFQSRHVTSRNYPVPESVPMLQPRVAHPSAGLSNDHKTRERTTFGDLHQRLLEEYAPPSIVINEHHNIVHLSESAGRYLQISGGEPSQNLMHLVKQELRLELRAGIYQAMQLQTNVEIRELAVNTDDSTEKINIHIRPVFRQDDATQGLILIVFEKALAAETNASLVVSLQEPVAKQLEEELMRVKKQLRSSSEQYEFQAEELKASNEELQAMNEELRSAAEELETSKEELQSINEELRTVNQELKIKVEETTIAGNNLQNLINSVDIGTIFLDRLLKVSMFTPAAKELFNFIQNDVGRPLSDITNRLEGIDLIADAELVLEKLNAIEREVMANDGRSFLMRIQPYRTTQDHINGIVITFIDVTSRKYSEDALRDSEDRFRSFVSASSDAMFSTTPDWSEMQNLIISNRLLDVNNRQRSWMEIYVPVTDHEAIGARLRKAIETKTIFETEHRLQHSDGSIGWGLTRAIPRLNNRGEILEWFGAVNDITGSKMLQQQKDDFISISSHELKTPLTSLKIYGEVMEERFEKAGRGENWELMRLMNGQVDRLIALMNNLFDTTKIAEGKLVLHLQLFALDHLIAIQVSEMKRLTKNHQFETELVPDCMVFADKERITQVITNLLSNAIKYSPEGGLILVQCNRESDMARVTIRDEGVGISEAEQSQVFNRFFRAKPKQTESSPGMGLGLYISSEIIQRHGGTISVKSETAEGSVFSFSLPLKNSQQTKTIVR